MFTREFYSIKPALENCLQQAKCHEVGSGEKTR